MKSGILVVIAVLVFSSASSGFSADLCFEHTQKKEYDKAIEICSSMITVGQGKAQTYNNRGLSYQAKKQFDQALSDFNKAIELDSKYSHAYSNRGNVYKDKGQFKQALSDYNKAVELNQNDPVGYYNIACVYSLQKASEDACTWLKKSIDKGFDKWEHIKKDKDLDNIRKASCYKAIMADR